VYLDARQLAGGKRFAERFPGITALCRRPRHRPRREPIPVTPAAHYMMGGVATDLAGARRSAGSTRAARWRAPGVHGANRLASNSLLEGLVFAERVARAVRDEAALPGGARGASAWEVPPLADRGAAQVAADAIRTTMWQHAAIDRSAAGLAAGLAELAHIGARLTPGMTEGAKPARHGAAHRRGRAAAHREPRRPLPQRLPAPAARVARAAHRVVAARAARPTPPRGPAPAPRLPALSRN
jgi:L-aspartate oxidase